MYELPSQKNVKRVVLDENAVTGQGAPILIYADESEASDESRQPPAKKLKDAAA
jgi:ATP-dependent Clp protease ATP-binding subunit ClpX